MKQSWHTHCPVRITLHGVALLWLWMTSLPVDNKRHGWSQGINRCLCSSSSMLEPWTHTCSLGWVEQDSQSTSSSHAAKEKNTWPSESDTKVIPRFFNLPLWSEESQLAYLCLSHSAEKGLVAESQRQTHSGCTKYFRYFVLFSSPGKCPQNRSAFSYIW